MRNSFLPLIPELETAIELLDKAAHAMLAHDFDTARELIAQADIKEVCEFNAKITGPTDPAIHWQSTTPPSAVPSNERASVRMPTSKEEQAIFERDGWRCQYCGCRVISKRARSVLTKIFPSEARWGRANSDKHCALVTLTASLDHILPHSRRGTNEPSNLVTACGPCQFGRNQWTLEEVGFNDPRERPPITDSWDGLIRIVGQKFKYL
jgi:5-methylcytosine-specific restriction endonuclease McrA